MFADKALAAFGRDSTCASGETVASPTRSMPTSSSSPPALGERAPRPQPLAVKVTRETLCYFRLDAKACRSRGRVVQARPPHGHDFYALADPLHGLKVGAHHAGPEVDPNDAGEPDPTLVERITDVGARTYRLADPDPVGAETCVYTTTPDETFVLERRGRVVVGSPCSGHGFKFAPAIGTRLAAARTRLGSTHADLPGPRRRPAQAPHPVPRERDAPDRGGHGPRGLRRERVDPVPPTSPCRCRSSASSSRSSARSGCPTAHAHRHFATMGRRRPSGDADLRPAAADVERGRRDLALPARTSREDYFYRNGEGDEVIFVHEGSGTLETIFGDLPYRAGDYVVVPRGTTYRFRPEGPQRHLVFESPGPDRDPAALPQRVRPAARARAVLPPRHPRADRAADAPRARRVPRQGARPRTATRRTSSTTTRSTSSAGTATSTRGRSRSTTSSRSRAGSTCRRRRTRRSRAATS